MPTMPELANAFGPAMFYVGSDLTDRQGLPIQQVEGGI
jgi:hypothetical protein